MGLLVSKWSLLMNLEITMPWNLSLENVRHPIGDGATKHVSHYYDVLP